jgi:hypothetical protein
MRVDRARRNIYGWAEGAGEANWYANMTRRGEIPYHLNWSNINNYKSNFIKNIM